MDLTDSETDGISGSLTIANATGTWNIYENFETGTELTAGLTTDVQIDGQNQTEPITLQNSSNDLARLKVGGAGIDGGTIVNVPDPSNLGPDAVVEFIVPAAQGGSALNITGDEAATDLTFPQEWTVAANAHGIIKSGLYQGDRTITVGDVNVEDGGLLEFSTGYSNRFAFGGSISIGDGATVDPTDMGTTPAIAAGSTLAGAGTFSGSISVTDDAGLAPGNSPGTLTVGGSLTFGDPDDYGAVYQWELGETAYDSVDVTGDLVFTTDGFATLELIDAGGTADPLTEYVLFSYDGSDPTTNLDWLLDYGSSPYAGGEVLVQADTNQVVLVGLEEIPEPTSLILLMTGGILMLSRRRRKSSTLGGEPRVV